MWRDNFWWREWYCGFKDGLILNHYRGLSARLCQLLCVKHGILYIPSAGCLSHCVVHQVHQAQYSYFEPSLCLISMEIQEPGLRQ